MKRLLFLTVLLVFVWAGIFLWPEKKDDQKTNWPDFKKLNIVQIQFDQFELTKDRGKWRVKEKGQHIQPYADQEKIDALIDFLQLNSPRRVLGVVSKEKLGEYGLDKPKKLVISASKKQWSVQIGDKNPAQDGVYALCSSYPGKLLLMNVDYTDKVGAESKAYYKLKLLPFDDEQITRVRLLEKNSTRWDITKKDGLFKFVAPEKITEYKVSSSEATSLFFDLGSLRGKEIVFQADNAKPEFLLNIFYQGSKTPLIMRIFKRGEKYLARVEPEKWYFVLDHSDVDNLDKSAFLLRDRTIAHFDTDRARKMEIAGADVSGKNIQLYQKDGVWKINDSNREVTGMGLYLWRLADLRYEEEPGHILPSTAVKKLTWTVKDKQDNELIKISFYEDTGLPANRCWACLAGEKKYYVVDSSLVNDVKKELGIDK